MPDRPAATYCRQPDDLREARERARKLLEQLEGTDTPQPPAAQPGSTSGVVGGRGRTADEMRQVRKTDSGV
jgi:hypothetical protein